MFESLAIMQTKAMYPTATNPELLASLINFELDDPDADFPFSARLALENGWDLDFCYCAILEYKKFIYLCCVSHQPVTPSVEVDQVWHLHLLYTESYWHDLCEKVLQRELHHGPTKGGQAQNIKFTALYAATLSLYEQEFGEAPLAEFWPSVKARFTPTRWQWVNTSKNWITKKPLLLEKYEHLSDVFYGLGLGLGGFILIVAFFRLVVFRQ